MFPSRQTRPDGSLMAAHCTLLGDVSTPTQSSNPEAMTCVKRSPLRHHAAALQIPRSCLMASWQHFGLKMHSCSVSTIYPALIWKTTLVFPRCTDTLVFHLAQRSIAAGNSCSTSGTNVLIQLHPRGALFQHWWYFTPEDVVGGEANTRWQSKSSSSLSLSLSPPTSPTMM